MQFSSLGSSFKSSRIRAMSSFSLPDTRHFYFNFVQNVNVLPMLQISDIEPEKHYERFDVKQTKLQHANISVPVFLNEQVQMIFFKKIKIILSTLFEKPTNGVVFFRAIANVNDLPAHLEPYLPLFCSVVTRFASLLFYAIRVIGSIPALAWAPTTGRS